MSATDLVELPPLDAAERTFEQLGSVGHRAAAWIAKADLDTSRGSAEAAAAHYRRAAEALQDFHF
ncbi:MAG: hypothetical protein E6G08_13700 [Actinobacteria bacterium]|nr:MAG: hypothetical protein E6G08_13700 [Actinomycetota bacterium]